MSAWPPLLPDHQILEPWRPVHPADLAELRERAGLGPCEAIECVARCVETGRLEVVMQLRPLADAEETCRPAPAGLDASPAAASDSSDVERAIAACRARWANLDIDALELERVLLEAMPGRAHLALIDGRARAFERLGDDPRTGRPRWRSMYVRTVDDVRRFAAGATR